MIDCEGWMRQDLIEVSSSTIRALEARGYARVARMGEVEDAAVPTALGRAALRWGGASVYTTR